MAHQETDPTDRLQDASRSDPVLISVGCSVVVGSANTPREEEAALMFGLTLAGDEHVAVLAPLEIPLTPGSVTLIEGPSGCGKSIALRQVGASARSQEWTVVEVTADDGCSGRRVLECVHGDLVESLRALALAGLADAHLWLREVDALSAGERYRLALLVGVQRAVLAGGRALVIVDEYCSLLDRTTAAGVCRGLARMVKEGGVSCLVASAHEDIVDLVDPEWWVRLDLGGQGEVISAALRRGADGPELRLVDDSEQDVELGEARGTVWVDGVGEDKRSGVE